MEIPMSMYPEQSGLRKPWELEYAQDDKVLSKFFNVVYAWMAVGLALTAAVGWFVAPHLPRLMGRNPALLIVCGLAAFAISMGVQFKFQKLNANLATALFLLYAALIGVCIAYIFLIYPPTVLVSAFVITAGTFAGVSAYGFVTRRDLTRIGGILIMCAWGLFLASIVNIFVASTILDWFITYAVLGVFIGITAYETQKLKQIALQFGHDPVMAPRFAIYGSLVLYISFLNIFLSILRILGDRR
jgi:FtsH-binding integral membrane protein